jgi:hypothetical protein
VIGGNGRGLPQPAVGRKDDRVGFQPSHNGQPGGALTGEHMSHYIVPGGPFEKCPQAPSTKHAHFPLPSRTSGPTGVGLNDLRAEPPSPLT